MIEIFTHSRDDLNDQKTFGVYTFNSFLSDIVIYFYFYLTQYFKVFIISQY